jgi:hypothetical protein
VRFQSASVICVSITGSRCRSCSDSMKCRFGNPSNPHIRDSVHRT